MALIVPSAEVRRWHVAASFAEAEAGRQRDLPALAIKAREARRPFKSDQCVTIDHTWDLWGY